jgi:acyl dehydratase
MSAEATFRIESVSAERMKTLSLLVDDPNPIHLSAEAAAAAGLGDRVINPGSANIGYVLNALLALGPDVEIERLRVSLRGNVAAGDALVAVARALDEEGAEAPGTMRCEFALDVVDGVRALDGTAVVRGFAAG